MAPFSFGDDGQATYIEGTINFGIGEGTRTDEGAGAWTMTGAPVVAQIEANDSRVSGEVIEVWNARVWGDVGAIVQWGGLTTITNEAGQWVGSYVGTFTPMTSDLITWWYTGRGGYAGLSLVLWITDSTSGDIRGIVFPGPLPPPFTTPVDAAGYVIVRVVDLSDSLGGQLAGVLTPVRSTGDSYPEDAVGGLARKVTQSSLTTTLFVSEALDDTTSGAVFPYVSGIPADLAAGQYLLTLWAAPELVPDSRWTPAETEGLRSCTTSVTVTAGEATIVVVYDLPSADESSASNQAIQCDTTG